MEGIARELEKISNNTKKYWINIIQKVIYNLECNQNKASKYFNEMEYNDQTILFNYYTNNEYKKESLMTEKMFELLVKNMVR